MPSSWVTLGVSLCKKQGVGGGGRRWKKEKQIFRLPSKKTEANRDMNSKSDHNKIKFKLEIGREVNNKL